MSCTVPTGSEPRHKPEHPACSYLAGRRVLCIRHVPVGPPDRIVRWFRRHGCEIDHCRVDLGEELPPAKSHDYAIVYGGPQSVLDFHSYLEREKNWLRHRMDASAPVLGICLGAQLMASSLGAAVQRHPEGVMELGYREVVPTAAQANPIRRGMQVFQWHEDGFETPPGTELLATGSQFPAQAFRLSPAIIGLQFHPEVTSTLFQYWWRQAAVRSPRAGADSETRITHASAREDGPIGRWLGGFLRDWSMSRGGN